MNLTEIFYYGGMVTMASAFLIFILFQLIFLFFRGRLKKKFKKEYGIGEKNG